MITVRLYNLYRKRLYGFLKNSEDFKKSTAALLV
jgi:hypothetical protein